MSNYTPGPWGWIYECGIPQVLQGTCDVPGHLHYGKGHSLDECGEHIMSCDTEWSRQDCEKNGNDGNYAPNEDDARLIAAAPDLLEALKSIAEGCSFPEDDVQRACRDRARAAIAKAEGK